MAVVGYNFLGLFCIDSEIRKWVQNRLATNLLFQVDDQRVWQIFSPNEPPKQNSFVPSNKICRSESCSWKFTPNIAWKNKQTLERIGPKRMCCENEGVLSPLQKKYYTYKNKDNLSSFLQNTITESKHKKELWLKSFNCRRVRCMKLKLQKITFYAGLLKLAE